MIACVRRTIARRLKSTFCELKHLEIFHYVLNKVPCSLHVLEDVLDLQNRSGLCRQLTEIHPGLY